MLIYLAGHVPKGIEEIRSFENWRVRYGEVVRRHFDAEPIDPMVRNLDESDFLSVVGLDCRHLRDCAFVIVNAETPMGIGTAQEMVVAKYFSKPVVTILPKESTHRKSNFSVNGQNIQEWIHPFLFAFSDFIIEDIDMLGDIKGKILLVPPKNISVIDDAIKYLESLT